jgi:hypothetical protein
MNSRRIFGSLAVLAFLLSSVYGYSQRMHHARYYYDPAKVATVSGEVTSVESVDRYWGNYAGIHLVLKTDSGSLTVYAGPSFFLKDKISFAKGDKIEVTGARTDEGGKPGIVAKEIKKGDAKVVLRRDDGTPLWAGAGRGGRRGR